MIADANARPKNRLKLQTRKLAAVVVTAVVAVVKLQKTTPKAHRNNIKRKRVTASFLSHTRIKEWVLLAKLTSPRVYYRIYVLSIACVQHEVLCPKKD